MFVIILIAVTALAFFAVNPLLGINRRGKSNDFLWVGKLSLLIGFLGIVSPLSNHIGFPNIGITFCFILLAIGCGVMLRANLFIKSYYVESTGSGNMPRMAVEENKNKKAIYISDDRNILMQTSDSTVQEIAEKLELTKEQQNKLNQFFYQPWK